MISYTRLRVGLSQLRLSEFAASVGRCPYCGLTVFVRLSHNSSGIRCAGCSAGVVQLSIGWALRESFGALDACDACELSARGALSAHLRRTARSVATSEYFAGVAPGSYHEGVRCEDVHRLTYADESFDLVTHTEVLEHVPDDARALTELLRVLRPGGTMIFTVPMHEGAHTIERARIRDGEIEHLLEPVHHADPLQPEGILAFRDYGRDILERLRAAGFVDARILAPSQRLQWLGGLPAIMARKPA
jgi:SAM-dependent methyltransferase